MAQIKVGSELKEPKSVNVYRDGEWRKEQMGYVYRDGEWVSFIEYQYWMYKDGEEYEEAYTYASNKNAITVEKKEDYIEMTTIYVQGRLDRWGVSFKEIDISEYSKVKMEWSIDVEVNDNAFSLYNFLLGVMDDYDNEADTEMDAEIFYEYAYESGGENKKSFDNKISEVDISDVQGKKDVVLHGERGQRTEGFVKIHKIWLE